MGLKGNPGQCVYSATKSALEGFTRSLAKEVASRKIRVNLLAPGTEPLRRSTLEDSTVIPRMCSCPRIPLLLAGFVHTSMTSGLMEEEVTRVIPLRRFGRAEEVALSVLFLLQSSYITGQVLVVDGGLHLSM